MGRSESVLHVDSRRVVSPYPARTTAGTLPNALLIVNGTNPSSFWCWSLSVRCIHICEFSFDHHIHPKVIDWFCYSSVISPWKCASPTPQNKLLVSWLYFLTKFLYLALLCCLLEKEAISPAIGWFWLMRSAEKCAICDETDQWVLDYSWECWIAKFWWISNCRNYEMFRKSILQPQAFLLFGKWENTAGKSFVSKPCYFLHTGDFCCFSPAENLRMKALNEEALRNLFRSSRWG